jgi:tetratricopeptide (TPR) repeat protein
VQLYQLFPPYVTPSTDPVGWVKAHEEKLSETKDLLARYSLLRNLAPAAYAAKQTEKAEAFAKELIEDGQLLKTRPGGNLFFYGQSVIVGDTVLGHLAFDANNIEKAKEYLLKAGDVPSSPLLNLIDPGMSLAKLLIEKGERETAIRYFDECMQFWTKDEGRLQMWKEAVAAGHMPYFGNSLTAGMTTWRVVQ